MAASLPTELWEAIINHVLEIPFLLDRNCTPGDFYFFAIAHRAWDAASTVRESYLECWKTLRAVCRKWMAIADRQRKVWVRLESTASVWEIPPETKRLDIFIPVTWSCNTPPFPPPEIGEVGFRNVQVVSVSEVCQRNVHLLFPSKLLELSRFMDVVARSGGPIHSFIYEGEMNLGSSHFQSIGNAFPHLVSLTLHAMAIGGTLSIPTLEVLWIFAHTFDISQWKLPSLRHLALGSQDGAAPSTLSNSSPGIALPRNHPLIPA
ncbi:hypothetical protein FRC17_010116, partial [Serendipita sp. 399]